ncbi:plasmid replication protein RepC [Bartonella sp. cb54]|uniref:plasmid replication protein RepC n=1 Tax=Bartonella sp. cb54 TaxID=3385560 RepID=UPI0039A583FA
MVKKTPGRRMGAHHIEYIKKADHADIGDVSRGQLISLVRQLPITGLIKATEVQLLHILLNTLPTSSFEKGSIPIVFKSNRQIGLEIGCSSVHTSRLLSRLFDKGLIVMRDSSNYKRFPVSCKGDIITACGIDLSILIVRYHELQHLIVTVKEEIRRQNVAARRFRGLYRQLHSYVALVETVPIVSLFWRRVRKITAVIGAPAKASFVKLEKAIKLLNLILSRLLSHKMLCRYIENVMHIHNTNPYFICKSNKANHQNNDSSKKQEKKRLDKSKHISKNNATFSRNKKAYENNNSKNERSIPLNDCALLQIKSEMWVKAMPHTAMYLDNNLKGAKDIIGSMDFLSKMLGISASAIETAKKSMGLEKTALAIGIILEKYSRQIIQSPGGYLRGMIARQNKGELYLERSLHGLLNLTE